MTEKVEFQALTDGLFHFETMNWNKAKRWIRANASAPDLTRLGGEIPNHDRQLEEYFQVRTKLDLSVRRLKFLDLLRFADSEIRQEMRYYAHLDIIFATNILLYAMIFGIDTLIDLRKLGLFNDFEHFVEMSAKISTYMKRSPYDLDDTKQKLCEIGSLIGYLQNDTEEWDTKEELEGLAQGGEQHGLVGMNWNSEFSKLIAEVQSTTVRQETKFITFEDYVKSAEWITSGSSSIGKVIWSYEEDKGKFKARKNMIEDIYTKDELWIIINGWNGQLTSRAFIKDEVGKRRLAVASNIEAYLHESYILRLFGHSFKNWDGITLDESPKAQHIRNVKNIELLRDGAYALPFDFRRFDHQPTTVEIQTMVANIANQISIPSNYAEQFSILKNKVISSYANSIITMQIGAETVVKQVSGGIPSGVRITSLIGNEWNSIMTRMAQNITKQILSYDPVLLKEIKGDDTGLLTRTACEAYIFRLSYQAINAIGLNSKFGISQNICEFLRNEISTTGVRGWSCRAIPTITQRKPWNPEPWTPSSAVATVASNIYLLERRLRFGVPKIHQANKVKWSKFTGQSTNWLELPVRLGGFGIYLWRGWEPNCKLPLVTKPLIQIDNLTDMTPFSWIKLSSDQLKTVHLQSITNKISTSDINGPQKLFSRDYIRRLRSLQVSWKQTGVSFFSKPFVYNPGVTTNPYWPKSSSGYIQSADPTFPDFQMWMRQYDLIKKASQYNKTIKLPPLKTILLTKFPNVHSQLSNLESNGWHRTDAINLCLGDMPCEPVKQLHPLLTPFIKETIRNQGALYWRGRKTIAIKLYSITTYAVDHLQSTETARMYSF